MRGARAYLKTNLDWFSSTVRRIRKAQNGQALLEIFQHVIAPQLQRGRGRTLGCATHSANYTIKLRRDQAKLVGEGDANLLIANLSEERSLLVSLGPLVGLTQAANGEISEADYLAAYGHRGPDEFELSVPRPAEDPGWVKRQIEQLRQSPVDASGLVQKQQQAFGAAWQRLAHEVPQQSQRIATRIAESVRRARLREEVRSAYVRDRWSLRLFALRAGELSGLDQDIFFLTLAEVLDLLGGDRQAVRFIHSRKANYHHYKPLPPYPSVISGAFDPLTDLAKPSEPGPADGGTIVLSGSPGSVGSVEGVVHVLADPENGRDLQPGEILVAYTTDIAWTLLFHARRSCDHGCRRPAFACCDRCSGAGDSGSRRLRRRHPASENGRPGPGGWRSGNGGDSGLSLSESLQLK